MRSCISRCTRCFTNHTWCKRYVNCLPLRKSYGTVGPSTEVFKSFDDMILFRRLQAERSALIAVDGPSGIIEALNICERFGTPTKKIVLRSRSASERKLVFLVEYQSTDEVKSLLNSCHYPQTGPTLPVFSRMLSYPMQTKDDSRTLKELQSKGVFECYQDPAENDVLNRLSLCQNVSQQLETFYELERLSDLESRLRFLFCTQVEDSLAGLLPHCQVLPFGSSVNGFGRHHCDLDMFLNLTPPKRLEQSLSYQPPSKILAGERALISITLDLLGDFMQCFFPSIRSVQKILRARVPILKVHHTLTGIDCDISCSNGTGFHMSELLFVLGELDPRVRPLVFGIRKWARSMMVTRLSSGSWMTNFSLTLLLIFFLQTRTPPILPTLKQLKEMAGPEDERFADSVDCTFKRTFTGIPKSANDEDIGSLLVEFFSFYSKTNWKECGLSLVDGELMSKPFGTPIFVQNPLEPSLNVCKNVSLRELEKFVSAVQDTLWDIERCYGDNSLLPFFSKKENPAKLSPLSGFKVSNLLSKSAHRNVTAQNAESVNEVEDTLLGKSREPSEESEEKTKDSRSFQVSNLWGKLDNKDDSVQSNINVKMVNARTEPIRKKKLVVQKFMIDSGRPRVSTVPSKSRQKIRTDFKSSDLWKLL